MNPTLSALYRVELCPGSHALPHTKSRSGEAHRGTIIHAFAGNIGEGMATGDALAKVAEVAPQLVNLCAELHAAGHLPKPGEAIPELAVAYDLQKDTARELNRGSERDYSSALPNEWVGTLDTVSVLAIGPAREGDVRDWKSGRSVGPARSNFQLNAGALAISRLFAVDTVAVTLEYVHEDGGVHRDRAVLDAWALEGVMARLERLDAALQRQVDPSALDLTMGDHCQYCPAFAHCPAQRALVRMVVEQPERMDPAGALTQDTAHEAYRVLKMLGRVMARLRACLEGYATEYDIVLDEKTVFGAFEKPSTELRPIPAEALLRKLWGEEGAKIGVEREVSQASVKRAIEEVVPPGKRSQAFRDFMAELRKGGGVVVTMKPSVGEHKRKDAP